MMTAETPKNAVLHDRFVLRSRMDELAGVESTLLDALNRAGYDQAAIFSLRLALEEAFTNALTHGNADDATAEIVIKCTVTPDEAYLEVRDQGDGFDPDSVPDPTAEENLEIPSGRGLMLIRAYMTDVEIVPPGNCIRIWYRREAVENPDRRD